MDDGGRMGTIPGGGGGRSDWYTPHKLLDGV